MNLWVVRIVELLQDDTVAVTSVLDDLLSLRNSSVHSLVSGCKY